MKEELTKSEKRIAREIIDRGLQKEVSDNLQIADKILNDWKEGTKKNMEAYHELYRHIAEFNLHIARRYDRMSGSNYLYIITAQLRDCVIHESDLQEFPEEICERLIALSKL